MGRKTLAHGASHGKTCPHEVAEPRRGVRKVQVQEARSRKAVGSTQKTSNMGRPDWPGQSREARGFWLLSFHAVHRCRCCGSGLPSFILQNSSFSSPPPPSCIEVRRPQLPSQLFPKVRRARVYHKTPRPCLLRHGSTRIGRAEPNRQDGSHRVAFAVGIALTENMKVHPDLDPSRFRHHHQRGRAILVSDKFELFLVMPYGLRRIAPEHQQTLVCKRPSTSSIHRLYDDSFTPGQRH